MNKEKEEVEEGSGIGNMITVAVVIMVVVVGIGLYQFMQQPYTIMDELRDKIDAKTNISDDYRQGWLDCISYYYNHFVAPTNITGG